MINHLFSKMTVLLALSMSLIFTTTGFAGPAMPEGKKSIVLKKTDGTELILGSITFTPQENGTSFSLKMDDKLFSDHFLNMYPFKCIENPKQMLCHLPYPYETKGLISPADFADLEYALLFIKKKPSAYGIKFWDGVYYKLTLQSGNQLHGEVYETDMNELAAPPDEKFGRLIPQSALTKGDPGNHLYPHMEIR